MVSTVTISITNYCPLSNNVGRITATLVANKLNFLLLLTSISSIRQHQSVFTIRYQHQPSLTIGVTNQAPLMHQHYESLTINHRFVGHTNDYCLLINHQLKDLPQFVLQFLIYHN